MGTCAIEKYSTQSPGHEVHRKSFSVHAPVLKGKREPRERTNPLSIYKALNKQSMYLYELLCKLLLSPSIAPLMLPYIIPYITPLQGVQTIAHTIIV